MTRRTRTCRAASRNPSSVNCGGRHGTLTWKDRIDALGEFEEQLKNALSRYACTDLPAIHGVRTRPADVLRTIELVRSFLDAILNWLQEPSNHSPWLEEAPETEFDAVDISDVLSKLTLGKVADPFRRSLRRCDQLAVTRALFPAALRNNTIALPLVRLMFMSNVVCGLLDRGRSLECIVTDLLELALDSEERLGISGGDPAKAIPGEPARPRRDDDAPRTLGAMRNAFIGASKERRTRTPSGVRPEVIPDYDDVDPYATL